MNRLYELYPILRKLDGKLTYHFYQLTSGEKFKVINECCAGFPFLLSGMFLTTQINDEGDVLYLYHIAPGQYCHSALKCMLRSDAELQVEVVAQTDVDFAFVTNDDLANILLKDPEFLLEIYHDCLDKLEQMMYNQLIKDMPIEQRLMQYFKQSKSKYIYMTHQMLAETLQTSREVISRHLKKMEREGLVSLERGRITLLKDEEVR